MSNMKLSEFILYNLSNFPIICYLPFLRIKRKEFFLKYGKYTDYTNFTILKKVHAVFVAISTIFSLVIISILMPYFTYGINIDTHHMSSLVKLVITIAACALMLICSAIIISILSLIGYRIVKKDT